MGLNVGGIKNIFPHSRDFDQGLGKIRKGAGTFVVALDGSGDFSDIQEAIDALPSTGGEVFIKEGTYITGIILMNKKNVHLKGTGDGTIIKTVGAQGIILTENDNKISNFKIIIQNNNHESIMSSGTTNNILIENIHIKGESASFLNTIGISLQGNNSRILNCIVEDCSGNGIEILSMNNGIISNCTMDGNDTGIFTDGATNCAIIGNTCKNCNTSGILLGDDNEKSDNNAIVGNVCSSNVNGIRVFGDCDKNIISSNQCNSNSGRGIWIEATGARIPDKNIITGNICLNNTIAAITDEGTDTHPNGASGTNNLALDDLNIIA